MDKADVAKATQNLKDEDVSVGAASMEDIHVGARLAADTEHNLSFREAISLYPTAVAWSLFFSLGVVM